MLCSIPDVVNTYKTIVSHWPVFQDPQIARNHPFFLTLKSKFKNFLVWYKEVPVGWNTLAKVAQKLAEDVPSLEGKRITNKTGQNIGINRLEEAMVPVDRCRAVNSYSM